MEPLRRGLVGDEFPPFWVLLWHSQRSRFAVGLLATNSLPSGYCFVTRNGAASPWACWRRIPSLLGIALALAMEPLRRGLVSDEFPPFWVLLLHSQWSRFAVGLLATNSLPSGYCFGTRNGAASPWAC